MNFGETILKLRKAKGWTHGQLASYSGVKRSYISRIENGDYTEAQVCSILGITSHLYHLRVKIMLANNEFGICNQP
jgi:transcriptional regulator with XRE-family HTH domain